MKLLVLPTKSVDKLNPEVANSLRRRNSPALEDPSTPSPPDKPHAEAADKLPPLVPVQTAFPGREVRARNNLQLLAPQSTTVSLGLVPQGAPRQGAPGYSTPSEVLPGGKTKEPGPNLLRKRAVPEAVPLRLLRVPTSRAVRWAATELQPSTNCHPPMGHQPQKNH